MCYTLSKGEGDENYEEEDIHQLSHMDSKKVKEFALLLSLHGFDLWMDEKNIVNGDYYTTKILNGIHESDIYLLFLSQASLQSRWIEAEMDFALREKIESKKLIIIPVILEEVDVPVSLSNIDYVDARFSLKNAVEELSKTYDKEKIVQDEIGLSSISFTVSKTTSVEGGPFHSEMTTEDLEEDRNRII